MSGQFFWFRLVGVTKLLGSTILPFPKEVAPGVSLELAERMCSVPAAAASNPGAGGVVPIAGYRNVLHPMPAAGRLAQ